MGGGARIAPPFLTAALDGGKYSQLHAPAYLPQEKHILVRSLGEAGWGPDPVWTLWRREKSFALTGN
jgi:hypothetical protein